MGDELDQDMAEHNRQMVETMFTYHTPTGDQPQRYEAIRAKAKELAMLIMETTPPSDDQSHAITMLRQAVMFANAAIACWDENSPTPTV